MKHSKTLFIVCAAIGVFAWSCAKEGLENSMPRNTSSNGALNSLFAQQAPPIQQFTIDAANGGTIYGARGARIYFSPNAFVYQNNMAVSGNVEIRLQEVYTKKDIIFSGGYTTSNGLPLVSGGEINVTAWQGSQELKLAVPAYATIPTPLNPQPMEKFVAADITNTRDFTEDDSSNVIIFPDTTQNPGPGPSSGYSYGFGLDSLDWTNCDQYYVMSYNDPNAVMTEFSLPVPQLFNSGNSMVFVTSSYVTFAAEIWDFSATTNKFLCNYYRLPIGYDFTFTVISEINGAFYYDSRTVTMTENMSITLNPQITTEAQIIQNVGNL